MSRMFYPKPLLACSQRQRGRTVLPVLAAVVFIALLADSSGDAPRIDTLEASRVVIKDTKGRPRITLGVDSNDRAVLSLHDANGRERGMLVVPSKSDCFLQLNDPNGRARVQLSAVEDFAKGGLFLFDGSETVKPRAVLGVGITGAPMLLFTDERSKNRLMATVLPDGNASIRILDADGKVEWQSPQGGDR